MVVAHLFCFFTIPEDRKDREYEICEKSICGNCIS